MKRIYITALLAATLTACNDRPADATASGATTNDTTNGSSAEGHAAAQVKDIAPKEGEVLLRLNYPKGFKTGSAFWGGYKKPMPLRATRG